MVRRYETIFIMRADLQPDEAGKLIDRYAGIIEGMEGTIIKVENWGKRKLAYPIEKKREGVYVRIDFVAQHKVVSEVERNLKIDDDTLRFQTVKLIDKVDMVEIEQEMAEVRKREEEEKKEVARRREEQKEEEQKEEEQKEEEQKEEEQKEEAISEPVREGVALSGEDAVAHDEGAQETLPIETDEEGAKEE